MVRLQVHRMVAEIAAVGLCCAGLLAVGTLVGPQRATAANASAWACSPAGYLFQGPDKTVTTVYRVDLINGAHQTAGSLDKYVNAVGFNVLDDFMYGYDQTHHEIVRIGSNFATTPVPSDIPARDWNTGAFDLSGHLWVLATVGGYWAEVDLVPGSTHYGEVMRSGQTSYPGAQAPPDWAFIDGAMYGINQQGNLVRFNTSAAYPGYSMLGSVKGVPSGVAFGAAYTDLTFLYVSANSTGRIYRVDVNSRTAVLLSDGPASANNDGARCLNARFPTLTVTKKVVNRADPADQFTIALRNASGRELTSATTTGAETSVSTETFPLDVGQTYTIIDSLSGPSTTADYTSKISCTNLTTGNPVGANGAPPTWAFTPTTTDDYACTVTNTGPPKEPALSLTKSVEPSDSASIDVGRQLTYSYVATNSGNVPLTNIVVHESGFSGSGPLSPITCATTALLPNASTTCTATYTVTQADVDAGKITNLAVASGTYAGGTVKSNQADVVVRPDREPALTMTKSADPTSATAAGTEITYSFAVKNTGNVTVDHVGIREDTFTGSGTLSPIVCALTTLAPSQSTTCTATYSVTSTDLDHGAINNSAVAVGTAPDDTPVESPPDDAGVVTVPKLTIAKSVSPSGPAGVAVGTGLTYTFTVTNESGVTITDVAVDDFSFSGTGTMSAITCDATTLAATESTTCTATYTVTQADVDAGQITNAAFATGTGPAGPVESPADDAKVTVDQNPALSLTKAADPTTVHHAGDVITYTLHVTNTGDVTITGVGILKGAFSGAGALRGPACGPSGKALAPGQSVTCTTSYTVTQADIDAGHITNTDTATGTNPAGGLTSSNPASATVDAPAAPALTLHKSATPAVVGAAGDQIAYEYLVTNTGNVTITHLAISETSFSGTGTPPTATCPTTTLAWHESTTCTATYTVVAGDLTKPSLTNTATATGTPPAGGSTTSAPSTATVELARPGLHLVKVATAEDTNGDGHIGVGDVVTWTFTITNTGNVEVSGISVVDPTAGTVNCPQTTLEPGRSMSCTAPRHAITAQEADAGHVVNTAAVHGSVLGLTVTSNTARAAVAVASAPTAPSPPAPTTPTPSLPVTGMDSQALALVGALLVGAGLIFLFAGRPRRRPSSPR